MNTNHDDVFKFKKADNKQKDLLEYDESFCEFNICQYFVVLSRTLSQKHSMSRASTTLNNLIQIPKWSEFELIEHVWPRVIKDLKSSPENS